MSSNEFWFPFDMQPKKGYELTLVNKSVDDEIATIRARLEELEKANVDSDAMVKPGPTPAVIKSGKFSVSSNKQVYFSPGNLQYQASTKTWRFAENQTDIIGLDNKNISSSYDGWIDLFGWGTSGYNGNSPYRKDDNAKQYGNGKANITGTKYDWGIFNTISNGGDKKWYTLTKEEWDYVFNERNTLSDLRYAIAEVDGVNGVILLPDNWNLLNYKLEHANEICIKSINITKISHNEWVSDFEAHGAVFLPAAGWRVGNLVSDVGKWGYYWSTTFNNNIFSYFMEIVFMRKKSWVDSSYNNRSFGCCVRLVYDAE